ncbi:putative DNA modification/repair radical SAM protein [Azospirillum fermentarium]|uniref:putative DNA modification/repair radical SAM protein n=1 Tax=Azospirillum fermentarium TaxID=1233114 RepID=UPI002225BA54|nr:putative DNA modification/repair radical SAM protein [Azospirillum fermentarium]MCW2248460.1 putative DNA modification/repair radical SAM protein [Azospirillum fermentarium]
MDLRRKLEILADAAKYDASCASSGGQKRDALSGGIGSTTGMGICHSFAPDGRCIALLKILLTNVCVFDCLYCVNRRSSNVPRARFTVDEVVRLTLGFYKRNMIEGLFLSSGIVRTPDHTMEELVRVVRCLRLDHGFRGYIHLKTIAEASPELVEEAGRYADRLSVNMELPTEQGLAALAPEKGLPAIRRSMGHLHRRIEETLAERRAPRFAPAGQSTQMIVGADGADDRTLLRTSDTLYRRFRLKRVYYSAFSPIPDTSHALPSKAPPLVREHRLYQADWLLRFYGFGVEEIGGDGGMLDLDIDPKLAWALAHRDRFPVDLNAAPREMLLRVPGLGVKTVDRLIDSRRHRRLRLDDLGRMRVPLRTLTPFVVTADHRPTRLLDRDHLRSLLAPPPEQLSLF